MEGLIMKDIIKNFSKCIAISTILNLLLFTGYFYMLILIQVLSTVDLNTGISNTILNLLSITDLILVIVWHLFFGKLLTFHGNEKYIKISLLLYFVFITSISIVIFHLTASDIVWGVSNSLHENIMLILNRYYINELVVNIVFFTIWYGIATGCVYIGYITQKNFEQK